MMQRSTYLIFKALKDGLIPFDGAHDIHTPRALVEEMLNKIKLRGNILVMFNIEFVISLVYTYNINPSTITFYSDHDNKSEMARRLGVKYITTLGTDMKFDVVVGNPPYQAGKNKLFYRQFVYKAFDLSTNLCAIITPASWNSGGMTSYKKDVIDNGLKEYAYLGNRVFKGSQNDVCYFICEKNYTGDVLVKNKDGAIRIKNVGVHGIMPHKNLESIDILTKLASFKGCNSLYNRGSINPEKYSTGTNKFVVQNGAKNQPFKEKSISAKESVGFGEHKVVVAYNSSIGNIGPAKYVSPDYSIGYAVACFVFNSHNECNNFSSYLDSKVIKFVIKNLKTSIQNAKNIFEMVPLVDMSKKLTDADLYKHFNFSKEEIAYIESNVK